MGTVIANLLPLIVVAALKPLEIVMTMVLLHSSDGIVKATAFNTGAMTARALEIVVVGYILGAAAGAGEDSGVKFIPPALVVALGVFLLFTGARKWCRKAAADARPPGWMRTVADASALMAFGMGALVMTFSLKQLVFTISAIAVIYGAGVSRQVHVFGYFFFIVAAQSLVLAPLVSAAIAPERLAKYIEAANGWLKRNNRIITIVSSLIFGAWFLIRGLNGLLAHGRSTTE